MTNINDTVRNALGARVSRDYDSHVVGVVNALNAREDQIKRRLSEYARGRGLSQGEVDRLLRDVGFGDDVAQVAQRTQENTSEVLRLVSQLNEQVADLNRRIQNL